MTGAEALTASNRCHHGCLTSLKEHARYTSISHPGLLPNMNQQNNMDMLTHLCALHPMGSLNCQRDDATIHSYIIRNSRPRALFARWPSALNLIIYLGSSFDTISSASNRNCPNCSQSGVLTCPALSCRGIEHSAI
jgi:hypothetical protein